MASERAGTAWDQHEIDVVVESYFRMLQAQLHDESFVKAHENRAVRELIDRSRGSVEFKYQNISAALLELGVPDFVRGYAPAKNMQKALLEAVARRWRTESHLEKLLHEKANELIPERVPGLEWYETEPPLFSLDSQFSARRSPVKVDFLELERRAHVLGHSGEVAIVERERRLLEQRGLLDLARKVEHVSKTQGDGLGFDVLSFDESGNEKYIEVKTTRWQREVPFFLTRNEVSFSMEVGNQYFLYRVFDFNQSRPGLYTLQGSLEKTCALEPVTYRAAPMKNPEPTRKS